MELGGRRCVSVFLLCRHLYSARPRHNKFNQISKLWIHFVQSTWASYQKARFHCVLYLYVLFSKPSLLRSIHRVSQVVTADCGAHCALLWHSVPSHQQHCYPTVACHYSAFNHQLRGGIKLLWWHLPKSGTFAITQSPFYGSQDDGHSFFWWLGSKRSLVVVFLHEQRFLARLN